MVSSGMKFVKFALFFFNMLLFLAGLILIVAGAVVQGHFNDYFAFFGGKANAAAILLIAVGVIMFVIGFFGCCGAYKESHCMIITFAVLLIIVLILEISAAVSAYLMKDEVNGFLAGNMKLSLTNYDVDKHEGVSRAWDTAQKQFSCCGVSNYTDWSLNQHLNNSVPDSCCVKYLEKCGSNVLSSHVVDNINTKGCFHSLVDWSMRNIVIIGGMAVALAIFQIIGIILACCLASALRHQYETV